MSFHNLTHLTRAEDQAELRFGLGRHPSTIKVLVACERSGTVRDAFLARDFDAWSCDRAQDDRGSNRHIRTDVRNILGDGWDMLIVAHPPCTRLCNSGVRWLAKPPPGRTKAQMWDELDAAADLFSTLWNVPHIPHVAVENPIMHQHAKDRIVNYVPFTQSVQPYEHGHAETKRTCLWLRNLPKLTPTQMVEGRAARVHRMSPSRNRQIARSRFYTGIAAAMADQWGDHVMAACLPAQIAA